MAFKGPTAVQDSGGGPRKFSEIAEVSDATLQVLDTLGFTTTTPVQDAVIPLFCGSKDVAVDACTGSGKTLAFVIPVVERLRKLEEPLKKHEVGAIIVSPTRELARQIFTVAQPFFESVPGVQGQLLVGGSDPSQDVATFKADGAQVLVGTPGRIDDVMKRCMGTMGLKRFEVLVLDEADRLLDMGFRQQLDAIMARLPKQRRTGLFSATQTEAVQALARAGLRNPVRVNVAVTVTSPPQAPAGSKPGSKAATAGSSVEAAAGASQPVDQKTPTSLQISYTLVEVDQRLDQVVRFLQLHGEGHKVIVYCLTCACVDYYALALKCLAQKFLPKLQVRALHGRMKQAARESTLAAFTELPSGVLLATDLAARGLDIPEVHWVVQVDPPQDPAAFVHRVGRTARAGRTGRALVYLAPHEATYVDFIRLRKVPLTEAAPLADAQPVLPLVRKEAESAREMMEAGTKAFVSYVRGYKEHQCRFIFRVQDLPIGRLATSFALLRLPHMPEVKRVLMQEGTGAAAAAGSKQEPKGLASLPHFTPSTVDPESIRFKDKAREKQRQKLQQQRAQQQAEAEAARAAQKHGKGGASGAPQPAGHKSGERLPAAKRRKLQARDEMAELEADYRLLKKVRRGKLSEHEFDVAAGLSSDSELSSEGMDEGDDGDYKGAAGQVSEAGRQQHPAQAQRKGQAGSGKKKNDRGTGTANGLSGPLATKSSAAGAQAAGSAQQSSKGSLLQQKLASKLKKQKRKQRKQQQQLSAGTAG